jgi:hypothetical protein
MGPAHGGKSGIQKHVTSGPEVTDPDKVTLTTGEPARFSDSRVVLGQDTWQRTSQRVSGIGRTDTGGGAFEQCSANFGFERLHLSRKRRLRHSEPNGSPIEASFLKSNQKRPQLSQHSA